MFFITLLQVSYFHFQLVHILALLVKGFLFFEVFFIFFYLFQNRVKMVDMIIHRKG
jgi:hypothetical protein